MDMEKETEEMAEDKAEEYFSAPNSVTLDTLPMKPRTENMTEEEEYPAMTNYYQPSATPPTTTHTLSLKLLSEG